MRIKVSDYVSRFLVKQKINDIFLISGGGMMHLLDSVTKQAELNLVFNLNEQASGICAEAYAQYTNRLSACLLTSGPGATNAVTGCAGAWMDSTPVLFLSGQAKTADMGQLRGLRFFGAQEIGIIPVVTPITKYAAIVLKANGIRYHLEKAAWLAVSGRRGPVWLDIPLDIQGSWVEEDELIGFSPEKSGFDLLPTPSCQEIELVYMLLNKAQRPVILIGHGVVADMAEELVKQFVQIFQIPVLATWRAKGVFADNDPVFMGYPGIPAPRYSNYVLQNADFVLIVGTRLNPALTAYQEDNFAPHAQKIMVDIEVAEIEKMTMPLEARICAGAGLFWRSMLENKDLGLKKDRTDWLHFCQNVKAKYPLLAEKQPVDCGDTVDGYLFAYKLSLASQKGDVIIGSPSGRTCPISYMAFDVKEKQRFINSMGIGSMGWCVPSAIACCFASGKQRTIVFEGDGSLQHNIQELALLCTYQLPIKLFIWSNGGYSSIYAMQNNNFEGRLSGCTLETGLRFPSLSDIAKAYSLPYYRIQTNDEIDDVLAQVLEDNEPCICEVMGSICFDEIPKSKTIARPDGTFESSKLENLFPFLPEEEVKENLPYWENP